MVILSIFLMEDLIKDQRLNRFQVFIYLFFALWTIDTLTPHI